MSIAAATDLHQDEILTGEAVALDVQPVGAMVRVLGAAIDLFITLVLVVVGLIVLVTVADSEATVAIGTIALLVTVLVALPTAVETLSQGRSLGKLAVGARIVRTDGGAIGFRHAFIRALVGVLEIFMTLGALAFLVALFTPRAQRLGDLVAGTYAERTRTPQVKEVGLQLPPILAAWAQTADVARLPVRLNRRMSQFVRQASGLLPAARVRLATELATEASAFVVPLPAVDPETFVLGVLVVRRERELRALELQNARTKALVAGT